MATTSADLLLQQFAECRDPRLAEELLEALVVTHAQPAVHKIVHYKLAFQGTAEAQDIDDVTSDVLVELIARLRTLKSEAPGDAIGAFSAYAATAAYHACNEYLRRKYPVRHRLKTRLRYLLSTDSRFAIWEPHPSEWLCGLRKWQMGGKSPIPGSELANWKELLADVPRGRFTSAPADVLLQVFGKFAAPLPFDDLVNITARLAGLKEATPVPEDSALEISGKGADPAEVLHLRRWMAEVWAQIRELPVPQRVALLLNLRAGDDGTPAITLLPASGIASLRQIAEILEFPAAELAAIWNELPWDDLTIARRMDLTRQQVINLRKSARERLIRRIGVKYR